MTLLRQSSLAALAALVLTASRFALAAIVARRLSPAGFGQFVYAQWLVDMAFLACSFGATGAVSRYVAEFSNDPVKLAAFIQKWQPWALVLPVLSGGVLLVGAWMSGLTFDLISIIFLALWAVASAAWAMQTAALTGFQRFDLIFYANLLAAVTTLVGAFVLPLSTEKPAILFALMAAAAGIAALPGLRVTYRFKELVSASLEVNQWQSIRRYALNMWLIALLWAILWSRGELPLVRWFMGDAGVASYAAVLTLFGGAIQGVMLGVSAVAPQLTRLWGEGRKDEALAMARSVMDLQLLVCGGTAIVLICFGPELIELAFGAKYRAQAETLAVLSFALVSLALSNQNHLLQIDTNGRFSRNASLVGLVVLMALAVVFIPKFGVLGAALARATTMMILALISIITVTRIWCATSLSMRNLTAVIIIVGLSLSLALLFPLTGAMTRMGILLGSFVLLALAIRDEAGMLKARIVVQLVWHSLPARIINRNKSHPETP